MKILLDNGHGIDTLGNDQVILISIHVDGILQYLSK